MTMNEFDHAALLAELRHLGREELAGQLDSLVQLLGEREFCRRTAFQLVLFAKPEQAIPSSLHRFVPLVRDGIEFFLAGMSYPRLRRVLLSRYLLRENEEPGERLLNLAVFFPTLHKLGQIIARNPHVDPEVKKWLVGLEHGDYGADPDTQVAAIRTELARLGPLPEIEIVPQIVGEASVAAVLPFRCHTSGRGLQDSGVFKILKPGVQDDLREELDILADTFFFLEKNREHYGLQEMKLTSLFREIRGDMAREVDLAAEQRHLAEAAEMYGEFAGVRIPRPAPAYSTPTMTAMEYIDGRKIGEVIVAGTQRKAMARQIFETVLCVPLFAEQESALFHGDPHAGNILVVQGSDREGAQVALLDWTLAGHLSRHQRELVMALLTGIMKNDSRSLAGVIESFAIDTETAEIDRQYLAERIKVLLSSKEYRAADPLRRSFLLLEKMTLDGIVFPSELILFRKAFFTLEGVLQDIHPGFAMGEAMEVYLARLLMRELPLRLGTSMFPVADRAGNYRSLLSNKALKELSLCQTIALWRHTMGLASSFVGTQMKLLDDFFLYFSGSRYWYDGRSR